MMELILRGSVIHVLRIWGLGFGVWGLVYGVWSMGGIQHNEVMITMNTMVFIGYEDYGG